MPQLDIFTFTSQFFWLSFSFWVLYATVFLNFVLPFAFILKTKEYLSIYTSTILNSELFSKTTLDVLKKSYSIVDILTLHVTKKISTEVSSLRTILVSSVSTFRSDTNFEGIKAYLSLSGLSAHVLSNRSTNFGTRIGLSLRNSKKQLLDNSVKNKKVDSKSNTISKPITNTQGSKKK